VTSPKQLYTDRLAARRATIAALERRDRALSAARLTVFVAGVVSAALAWGWEAIPATWVGLPVACFVALILIHDRVIERLERGRAAARWFELGILRLDGRWPDTGTDGARHLRPEHPYAADLDLFGSGSLYQRLCSARTVAGEDLLADWLLAPASKDVVVARQAAIAELRDRLDLREEMALLAADVRTGVDSARLAHWGQATAVVFPPGAGPLCWIAGAAGLAALIGWPLGLGHVPLVAMAMVVGVIDRVLARRTSAVTAGLSLPPRELELLVALLQRLAEESFGAARLVELREVLRSGGATPARALDRLARLVHLLDSRGNPMFAPFAFLVLWTPLVAMAIEGWRRRYGSDVARWLAAVGELEALSSLAGYAFECPDDPFPEIASGDVRLEAHGLAHPLLDSAVAVRNDVTLDGAHRLLVISGSNMSGKSTLLRTVGTNTVLALAGAPVRAARFVLTPLEVGASIRLQDSLAQGESRFYAEILRLKAIVEQAEGERPSLYLLDEILHGTNSHDRRIGAEAVVRGLVERGSIGLVTTHDLALAKIVDALAPHAKNVHFEDRIEDGKILFDYRVREGVVTRSNALDLMRSIGLDV